MYIWEDKKMEKKNKNKKVSGITITGDITVKGPMFDIHDNQHVHINHSGGMKQMLDDDFEYVNLVFFDTKLFGTYDKQLALRNLFMKAFKKMALDTGRDLVAIYIAYHFLKDKLFLMEKYTDFFQDIDSLIPNKLPKVKDDIESRTLRYKSYIESLSTECEKWFVDNDCLPDRCSWKSNDYKYQVDDKRRIRIQSLVTEIYQGMITIIR